MDSSGFCLRSPPREQPDIPVPGRDHGHLGDFRVDRTRLHSLTDILALSVLAVICGADSFVVIALFGRLNEEWLRTFLELPNGIPSPDTLGRVFARLDAARFEECFRNWIQAAFQLTGGQAVPVDGKCLRGSHDRGRGLESLHPDRRLGRGQPPGADPDRGGRSVQRNHGHPGVAAHAVPEGCIVTLGAMARRKAIAHQIREQGADYLLRVRATRGSTRAWWSTWALERAGHFAGYAHDDVDTVGKGHGRFEIRRCWTTGAPDLLAHVDPDREWRDLASLVRVESEHRCGNRVSTEIRIFTSILSSKAKQQLQTVRKHWSVEKPTPGLWTWPSARTAAASARAMPPTT